MKTLLLPVDEKTGELLITEKMKINCMSEFSFYQTNVCIECLDKANIDCETCHGVIEYNKKIIVPWSTCKEIYKAMALAAAI